jgi:hypothetical protein
MKYLKLYQNPNGRLTTWRNRRSCLWNYWYWKALTEGIKAFEPGLLAKANRTLYVDE